MRSRIGTAESPEQDVETAGSGLVLAALDTRDGTADGRDRTAEAYDTVATGRDALARLRDERAELRDQQRGHVDVDAAADRFAAREDRQSAGGDRDHASHDRHAAFMDRSLSATERADLLVDELTGTYRRAAGFLELEREIIKAERTRECFVMAFIDVDGLKVVNDTSGHRRGDLLLQEVVRSLRGVVREYDIIVRYGGDEFVCGLAGMGLPEVGQRLSFANTYLRDRDHNSVSIGLAEREPGEGLESLIARADTAMYEARALRRSADNHGRA